MNQETEALSSQLNSIQTHLLRFKKDVDILNTTEFKDKEQNINELISLLNEIETNKNETENLFKLNKSCEIQESSQSLDKKQLKELLSLKNEHEELQKEYDFIQETLQKVSNITNSKLEYHQQNLKQLTHESQMNIKNNDQKLFNQINKIEQELIDAIEIYAKKAYSSEDIVLKKYSIIEMITGLKVVNLESENYKSNSEKWYDILFTNLPDECMDFENLNEDHPLLSKAKSSELSNELLNKYRTIFKKRKQKNFSKNTKNCVTVNDLNDFQIIYQNYLTLKCFILGKQEIEEAKKLFALDWIEGSKVITILINSKASKMATIVLPKFYPLSGTSLIKLISLSGYETSAIEKFKIEKNLGSLSEWISKFTDLYNSNQIL